MLNGFFLVTLCLTVWFNTNNYNEYINSCCLTIMSICLVYMCSSDKLYKCDFIFNNSILNYLGKISYGIYLYHKPIPFFTNYILDKINLVLPSGILFYLYSIVTFLITLLSWYTVEKYFLNKKAKIA